MSEYKVTDYGAFGDAVGTTNSLNQNIENSRTTVAECKTILSDGSIFMGPAADECVNAAGTVDTTFSTLISEFTQMNGYFSNTSGNYQAGDNTASTTVQNAGVTPNGSVVSSVTIPDSVNQAGYTVTCYGEGGWYLSGKSTPTSVAKGTKQKSVHEMWLADGARYKNGIAVMKVNGVDHYLIATASKLGKVGDSVNVKFANGQSIPCVIADAKSSNDRNYTTYGHGRSNGSVNILEFEVDRKVYNSKGNPTTSKWGLDWDSSSKVKQVDNYGSVV